MLRKLHLSDFLSFEYQWEFYATEKEGTEFKKMNLSLLTTTGFTLVVNEHQDMYSRHFVVETKKTSRNDISSRLKQNSKSSIILDFFAN